MEKDHLMLEEGEEEIEVEEEEEEAVVIEVVVEAVVGIRRLRLNELN